VHNPPPRQKNVLRHPAKFPETLAQEFIEFFTKPGQVVAEDALSWQRPPRAWVGQPGSPGLESISRG